jgi:DNA-binding transcriptional ArsR family regulator
MYKYACVMQSEKPTPAEPASRQASVQTLAAMTHPVRRRLIDLLSAGGPATVGTLADETGQRVGSISHHLKVLAANGLIEEAPELARDRRESWWRIVKASWQWSVTNFEDDPAGELIARAAEEQTLRSNFDKAKNWYDTRDQYGAAWVEAAIVSTSWLKATPDELADLNNRMVSLLHDFAAEQAQSPDVERESVYLFSYGMPVKP